MVVGLGRFGAAAAEGLLDLDQDVIGVDSDLVLVQRYANLLNEAIQVDATDIDAMRLIGAAEVGSAIVAIGWRQNTTARPRKTLSPDSRSSSIRSPAAGS